MNPKANPIPGFDAECFRGFDRGPFVFTYQDPSGNPINLTNYTAAVTIKDSQTGAPIGTLNSANGGCTIPTPTNGQIKVTFLGSITSGITNVNGTYYLEITPESADPILILWGNLPFRG